MAPNSLITPLNWVETPSLIRSQGPPRLQKSGKDTSHVITNFMGLKHGTHSAPVKKIAFMWSIWHKAMAINEWRARIALASISKQCVFCLPNTSELIKHKFWDCIQARRAWRWATSIMHELYKLRFGNYDYFNGSKPCSRRGFLRNMGGKKIKIWHLLRGITLWII